VASRVGSPGPAEFDVVHYDFAMPDMPGTNWPPHSKTAARSTNYHATAFVRNMKRSQKPSESWTCAAQTFFLQDLNELIEHVFSRGKTLHFSQSKCRHGWGNPVRKDNSTGPICTCKQAESIFAICAGAVDAKSLWEQLKTVPG